MFGMLLSAVAGEHESGVIERITPIGHRSKIDADRQYSDDAGHTDEMSCVL